MLEYTGPGPEGCKRDAAVRRSGDPGTDDVYATDSSAHRVTYRLPEDTSSTQAVDKLRMTNWCWTVIAAELYNWAGRRRHGRVQRIAAADRSAEAGVLAVYATTRSHARRRGLKRAARQ